MHIDWDNTVVTGISSIKIEMVTKVHVSIFTDNDLTHINDDHFEIYLVAQYLNQIYVVPVPLPKYDYDDLHVIDELTQVICRCNGFCTSTCVVCQTFPLTCLILSC